MVVCAAVDVIAVDVMYCSNCPKSVSFFFILFLPHWISPCFITYYSTTHSHHHHLSFSPIPHLTRYRSSQTCIMLKQLRVHSPRLRLFQRARSALLPLLPRNPGIHVIRDILRIHRRSRKHRMLPIRLRLPSIPAPFPTMTLIDLAMWLVSPFRITEQYCSRISFSRREESPGNMLVPPERRMFL